ncbi:MAG: hypothetical protein EAZ90_06355 [Oscillatoriales cyanobacterium]|nr:MAG: hypothetical protein EAZ94_02395 [Oscillatoriales cyanobacterium]TAE27932.1 MAG: hypothetical protein EAZ93_03990 [Oscillatoriales cyanobacterium]TAE44499.1 MAG: hypothetical protein EAZ90_06355 [Oscillatoriales cyanobacterium]TAE56936.1 MAG: hypothetical protein EAZ88_03050 [Oscillatoriales cyanobacterium]TAE71192.1 MAG: hypothetical protein EAZ86_04170 [Oscillatoriales cyanobacterium]
MLIGLELPKSFESNFRTGSSVHPTRKKNCGWAGEPVLAIFATSLLSQLTIAREHSQSGDRAHISNLEPKRPESVTIFNIARTSHSPELTCIGI